MVVAVAAVIVVAVVVVIVIVVVIVVVVTARNIATQKRSLLWAARSVLRICNAHRICLITARAASAPVFLLIKLILSKTNKYYLFFEFLFSIFAPSNP